MGLISGSTHPKDRPPLLLRGGLEFGIGFDGQIELARNLLAGGRERHRSLDVDLAVGRDDVAPSRSKRITPVPDSTFRPPDPGIGRVAGRMSYLLAETGFERSLFERTG